MAKQTEFERSIPNGRKPKMVWARAAFKLSPVGPPYPILADEDVVSGDFIVSNIRFQMKGTPIDGLTPTSWLGNVYEF